MGCSLSAHSRDYSDGQYFINTARNFFRIILSESSKRASILFVSLILRENTVHFVIPGLTRNPAQTFNGLLCTPLNTGFRSMMFALFAGRIKKLQLKNRNPWTMITGCDGLRTFLYYGNLARTECASLRLFD